MCGQVSNNEHATSHHLTRLNLIATCNKGTIQGHKVMDTGLHLHFVKLFTTRVCLPNTYRSFQSKSYDQVEVFWRRQTWQTYILRLSFWGIKRFFIIKGIAIVTGPLYLKVMTKVKLTTANGRRHFRKETRLWFTSLQRYFRHIATWKQEITNLWNSSGETGNRTRTHCSASQELNHSTIAAPIKV